jgi:hypothetical protein
VSTIQLTTPHEFMIEIEKFIHNNVLCLNLPTSFLIDLEGYSFRVVSEQFMVFFNQQKMTEILNGISFLILFKFLNDFD